MGTAGRRSWRLTVDRVDVALDFSLSQKLVVDVPLSLRVLHLLLEQSTTSDLQLYALSLCMC